MGAQDEVIVVFGGSSGIGEAVARAMVVRGSRVVITGRDHGRLAAASDRLGGAVQTAAVDVFFAGRGVAVDHLVLSFSTGRAGGPFRDLAMADLAAAVAGKLVAYLSVLQASLGCLRPGGPVTLIGAGSAEAALPGTAELAAVNGGLHAAVRPLAVELAPLRVNAVAPGVIETAWWGGLSGPVREGVFASAAAAPAGRTGTPDDVAAVVALLIECE